MRTLPITVAADADYPLPGLLTLPDGAGPFPAVLLVHGSGAPAIANCCIGCSFCLIA